MVFELQVASASAKYNVSQFSGLIMHAGARQATVQKVQKVRHASRGKLWVVSFFSGTCGWLVHTAAHDRHEVVNDVCDEA
jgi:hypothetical protein